MKPRQPPKHREGANSGRTFWEMRTITLVINEPPHLEPMGRFLFNKEM